MFMRRFLTFKWDGFDHSGHFHQGEIVAQTEILARTELRQLGIRPKTVRRLSLFRHIKGVDRIRSRDIADFSRQLATLLDAGVPLLQAFEVIGCGHEHPAMKNLLLGIKMQVEKGNSLADSLTRYPQQFNALYCNLTRVGEQAGILDSLLIKIADNLEKSESLKKRMHNALTYPLLVVLVACIVSSILLIFVVPQFESLFRGFGASLPALTQWVILLSRNFGAIGSFLLIISFLLGYGFVFLKRRSGRFNIILDRIQLNFPFFGSVLRKAIMARFTRTLSVLTTAGVPLIEALSSVAGACGNQVYFVVVHDLRHQVATGFSLHKAMRSVEYFPDRVIQLVAIGEESGTLDTMLCKAADYYESEVDLKVEALSTLVEPVIMAILGVLVGGLVLAMYLPLFKLGGMM